MDKNHCLALLLASGIAPLAQAASFQILEQSPAQLGKAFAGTASDTADATSVFFNPAAITSLDRASLSVGGNAIFTRAEFTNGNSTTNGTAGTTDETGYVPNIYLVAPLSEQLAFGLGLNAPYGLASSYNKSWLGRYLATDSELEVVNLSAVLAVEISDYWSLGLGADYQRAEVTLQSQVDSTLGVNPAPATDSSAKIKGDDSDISANISVYFAPSERTRLGLLWRQNGRFDLQGSARFDLNPSCSPGAGYPTGPAPAPTTGTLCAASLAALSGNAEAKLQLPASLTLSGSQQLSEGWWLHTDIAWTEWSSIQRVAITHSGNQLTINQLHLQYQDSMRYALGFSYKSLSPWRWRFGMAIDEAPQTVPELVSPRIPDQDRLWFSAGFNYAFSSELSLDMGYAYIKVDKIAIDNTEVLTGHRVQGDFAADVSVVGVQLNWAL